MMDFQLRLLSHVCKALLCEPSPAQPSPQSFAHYFCIVSSINPDQPLWTTHLSFSLSMRAHNSVCAFAEMAFPLYHLSTYPCAKFMSYTSSPSSVGTSLWDCSLSSRLGQSPPVPTMYLSWLRAIFVHNPLQQITHPLNSSSLDHLYLEHTVNNSLLKWNQKKNAMNAPHHQYHLHHFAR